MPLGMGRHTRKALSLYLSSDKHIAVTRADPGFFLGGCATLRNDFNFISLF